MYIQITCERWQNYFNHIVMVFFKSYSVIAEQRFPAREVKSMNKEINVTANREYKSNVFSMLFSNKEKLLELYNSLNHSHYTKDDDLEIVTLKNAIYMSMKNDLAFVLDSRLMLYEHQSTPNPNMPLRNLFYVSREYEKMVVTKTLYSREKVSIPAPHFIVFYNGMEKQPERKVLKLSDLYQVTEKTPMLELQVELLNINDGNNEELKESCQPLKEYMLYVKNVRYYIYEKKLSLSAAVEQAVTECIKKGILAEFLTENRAEVVAMSIFEFDAEKEWKLIREAEYRYGVEQGIQQGIKQGVEQERKRYLIQNICKKLRKAKTVDIIAEELEEDVDVVRKICETAKDYAPEYNENEILKLFIQ